MPASAMFFMQLGQGGSVIKRLALLVFVAARMQAVSAWTVPLEFPIFVSVPIVFVMVFGH